MRLNLSCINYDNVQDYSIIYNNAVCVVMCEGWHFIDMWKTLPVPHHITKKGDLGS